MKNVNATLAKRDPQSVLCQTWVPDSSAPALESKDRLLLGMADGEVLLYEV